MWGRAACDRSSWTPPKTRGPLRPAPLALGLLGPLPLTHTGGSRSPSPPHSLLWLFTQPTSLPEPSIRQACLLWKCHPHLQRPTSKILSPPLPLTGSASVFPVTINTLPPTHLFSHRPRSCLRLHLWLHHGAAVLASVSVSVSVSSSPFPPSLLLSLCLSMASPCHIPATFSDL